MIDNNSNSPISETGAQRFLQNLENKAYLEDKSREEIIEIAWTVVDELPVESFEAALIARMAKMLAKDK